MSKSMIIVRRGDREFCAADAESGVVMSSMKINQPYKIDFTQWSQRSLQHHKLYWGGLLALTMDYWNPTGGLVSDAELKVIHSYSRYLERLSESHSGTMKDVCEGYVSELIAKRGDKIQVPHKCIKDLHRWVKLEAGYYDLIMTPAGITKKPKSINFNAMSQNDFNVFYKKAFTVIWNFILSRTFSNEAEAHNAVNQLLGLAS